MASYKTKVETRHAQPLPEQKQEFLFWRRKCCYSCCTRSEHRRFALFVTYLATGMVHGPGCLLWGRWQDRGWLWEAERLCKWSHPLGISCKPTQDPKDFPESIHLGNAYQSLVSVWPVNTRLLRQATGCWPNQSSWALNMVLNVPRCVPVKQEPRCTNF